MFNFKTTSLLAGLMLCLSAPALPNTVVVGELEFDDAFINSLQIVSPGFSAASGNVERLEANVYKHYLADKAKADDFRRRGMTLTPGELRQLRLIESIALDKYLASLVDQHEQRLEAISDEDILAFYQQNQARYTVYGTATFLQAFLSNTATETVASATRSLNTAIPSAAGSARVAKTQQPGYSINQEVAQTIDPSHPYRAAFLQADIGEVFGPFTPGSELQTHMLIAVLEREPDRVPPVEQIWAQVRADLQHQRKASAAEQSLTRADRQYPIVFSPSYKATDQHAELKTAVTKSNPSDASPIFGTVGGLTIDNRLLAAIQRVNPQFHFSNNPDSFRRLLQTWFTIPKAKADRVSPDELIAFEQELDHISSLVENDVLSSLWDKKIAGAMTVTEAEANAYYRANRDQFMRGGSASVLLAMLHNDDAETIAAARSALDAVALQGGDLKTMKQKHDGFTIVYESGLSVDYRTELYSRIADDAAGQVAGPFKVASYHRPVLVYVTASVSDEPVPFATVKDHCQAMVQESKHQSLLSDLREQAFTTYPVEVIENS